jgi:hypothetical protein
VDHRAWSVDGIARIWIDWKLLQTVALYAAACTFGVQRTVYSLSDRRT